MKNRKINLEDNIEEGIEDTKSAIEYLNNALEAIACYFDYSDEVVDIKYLIERFKRKKEELEPIQQKQWQEEADEINREYIKSVWCE